MASIQQLTQSFLLRALPLTLLLTVILTPLVPLNREGLLLLLLAAALLPIELAFFVFLANLYYTTLPIVGVSFFLASLISLYGPPSPLNHVEVSTRALHRPLRRFLFGVNEILNCFLVASFDFVSDSPLPTGNATTADVSAALSSASSNATPKAASTSNPAGPPGGDDGYTSGDEAAGNGGGAAGGEVGGVICPAS